MIKSFRLRSIAEVLRNNKLAFLLADKRRNKLSVTDVIISAAVIIKYYYDRNYLTVFFEVGLYI